MPEIHVPRQLIEVITPPDQFFEKKTKRRFSIWLNFRSPFFVKSREGGTNDQIHPVIRANVGNPLRHGF